MPFNAIAALAIMQASQQDILQACQIRQEQDWQQSYYQDQMHIQLAQNQLGGFPTQSQQAFNQPNKIVEEPKELTLLDSLMILLEEKNNITIKVKAGSSFSLIMNPPHESSLCGVTTCESKADSLIMDDTSNTVIAICQDCFDKLLTEHKVN